MPEPTPVLHAAVVGGSYAGLAAALQLARARRRVLVVDAGLRRNRFAAASHGFLGQDGRAPGAIVDDARAQLLRYPNVAWRQGNVLDARGQRPDFALVLDDGSELRAECLVLATGVRDTLPAIAGLAERWGRSVFHCPYCHGYELEQGRIGVIATSAMAEHQALMLPDWGRVTLFANDAFSPDDSQRAALLARGVNIVAGAVQAIEDIATVVLADARRIEQDGLFVASRTAPASPLAAALGCAHEDGPLGPFVHTDALKQTSVPGVFACGDAARAAGSVALAVGDGTQAGVSAHRALLGLEMPAPPRAA
jgi:thioredoxin reductase